MFLVGEARKNLGKGGGGPEGVTDVLHRRDTAGPPLWGGVLGTDGEDGSGPGRLPGQGR